ncbi:hypothetical protein PAALTS15_28891 [Paenibacillus alvei TS-15]|uniref:Uncharacterized protein n=1 Tax=Paenibacillus alvei TS-15 TaxID=1117108 RepID=S9SIA1_PAEAL|nr:tetratricopeptide repeat protein [Paenibacillus alvei]EPY03838.1 hypothetical protein PAALTS15_28891 [Paenibacillus alvei TS-15]
MNQVLMDQLNQWHEDDEHQRIVDTLLAIPENERDYKMKSRLVAAYNNLGLFEDALQQADRIAEEGQHDPLWHYRVGFTFYHVKRYEEAVQAFRTADQLQPGDEDIEYLMELSLTKSRKTATTRTTNCSQERSSLESEWISSDRAFFGYVS